MASGTDSHADLLALGRQTVASVARKAADGQCTFHCQLLASQFYEALKREMGREPAGRSGRLQGLFLALIRCERAAAPRATPATILRELNAALAALETAAETGAEALPESETAEPAPVVRMRPQLRVIQGGLSLQREQFEGAA